jgi:tellurite resistance protein TehA-like permease
MPVQFDRFVSPWFLLPQGTGIVAVILHQLDYQFHGLQTISVIIWLFQLVLLLVAFILYLARFAQSPGRMLYAIVNNTTEAACLASISVAFTSAIQMMALVVVPSWGGAAWGQAAFILWWINTGMAVIAVLGIPLIFVHSIHAEGGFLRCLTPTTQLPLIAALTSAAGAGTLCQVAMLSDAQKLPMMVVSYLEIGVGVPLALALDILFMVRVFQEWDSETGAEPLAREQVYTDMVLCGPWGQSSFALQILGQSLLEMSTRIGSESSLMFSARGAEVIAYASMFSGLVGWGQGTFWWVFAVASISRSTWNRIKRKSPLAFGLPTWAIVFPWVSKTVSSL